MVTATATAGGYNNTVFAIIQVGWDIKIFATGESRGTDWLKKKQKLLHLLTNQQSQATQEDLGQKCRQRFSTAIVYLWVGIAVLSETDYQVYETQPHQTLDKHANNGFKQKLPLRRQLQQQRRLLKTRLQQNGCDFKGYSNGGYDKRQRSRRWLLQRLLIGSPTTADSNGGYDNDGYKSQQQRWIQQRKLQQ